MSARVGATQAVAGWARYPSGSAGGKSELHRTGCQLTTGGGDPEDSATENKPPTLSGAGKGETAR